MPVTPAPATDEWDALDAELDAWPDPPTFWWRDDDTVAAGPTLDRLLDLSERHGAPMHLAVIPAHIEPSLKPRLAQAADTWVFQHGFAHINHEPRGLRASEVGVSRAASAQHADLTNGWAALQTAGLPRLLPLLVPPWNRIAPETVASLPALGFRGLSAYGPRHELPRIDGLQRLNGHVDPVRWKDGAQFRGIARTCSQMVEHLAARRTGTADSDEPTGLVTHHLQTDAATWDFLEALMARLAGRSRWLRAADLIGVPA